MNTDELDAKRFRWLIDNVIEHKPAGYDGCCYGRFDMFLKSGLPDIRKAIDAELKKWEKMSL